MNIGGALLYTSFIFTVLAVIFLIIKQVKIGLWSAGIAAVSITASVLALSYAFVSLDFSTYYVWMFGSDVLTIGYRLAAMLVGQDGTYLVWAWLSILITFINLKRHRQNTNQYDSIYALAACSFLLLLTIIMNPFRSVLIGEGASIPAIGNSINPALVDILMPIHIFTAFAAYAFALVPAAVSIAYLTTGKKHRIKDYLRLSWLFLSISIILGGIWANRLLGWTGFWQWDPIQSVTLATWLLITAALHAEIRFNVGEYRRLFPLLCIYSFIGCICITFVARSGIYNSIHTFLETPTFLVLLIFILIIIIISALFALLFSEKIAIKSSPLSSAFAPYNTFYFTILLLIVLAFIAFWGPNICLVLQYMGYRTVVSTEFYNGMLYIPTILLAYLTGICMLYGKVKNKIIAYVTAIFLIINTILVFATQYSPVILILPAFFFITSNTLFRIVHDTRIKNRTVFIHRAGVGIIHLGFGFALLGAVVSMSLSTVDNFSFALNEENVYKENADVCVKLLDFKVNKVGSNWIQTANIELTEGDRTNNLTATFMKHRQFGFVSRPAVKYSLLSATIVDLKGMPPCRLETGHVDLVVNRYPLLNVLWAGCTLLLAGVILTLLSRFMRRRR
ncbi:MAG: hypothetical protein EF812_02100 [Methanosarcinales archaeon]|nr:MAG: hypothetical protein EF812_02100 [Methanosarcinales archaeon]